MPNANVERLREDLRDDRRESKEYRAGVRDELSKIVLRQTHMEHDLASVKTKVEAQEKITIQTTTLISRAEGAGTLGQWLIRIGIGVVGFAGWVVGVYTWITGRPPP